MPYLPLHREMMVFFVEPEARDILYMLADYIDGLEDRLDAYGGDAVAQDEGLQEEQANLAVALRLYEKLEKEIECILKDEQQARELKS